MNSGLQNKICTVTLHPNTKKAAHTNNSTNIDHAHAVH